MSNKNFDNIKIPVNIDDSIEKGVKKALNEQKEKSKNKYKNIYKIAAASLAGLITLGVVNPSLASKIPFVGNVFEAIEENIQFSGNYSQYATSVNETVYSNGIGVTLSEIVCDGQGLYVTYIVENEEPFKYTSWENGKELDMNQLITEEKYNKADFTNEELDNSGFAGLEGKFIDEYTFVGVQKYDMTSLKKDLPDEFNFKTKIKSIQNYAVKGNEKNYVKEGTWAFNVPVKVNKNLKIDITLENIENDIVKFDSISITPFEMIVKNTYKKGSWDNYDIRAYDENGDILPYSKSTMNNEGKTTSTYFKSPGESKSIRVIVERYIDEKINSNSSTEETTKENSTETGGYEIVFDKVIYLDK